MLYVTDNTLISSLASSSPERDFLASELELDTTEHLHLQIARVKQEQHKKCRQTLQLLHGLPSISERIRLCSSLKI